MLVLAAGVRRARPVGHPAGTFIAGPIRLSVVVLGKAEIIIDSHELAELTAPQADPRHPYPEGMGLWAELEK